MRHIFYASFDKPSDAVAAVEELSGVGTPTDHCEVIIHSEGLASSVLATSETASHAWVRGGLLVGVALGAALGAAFAPALGIAGLDALVGAGLGGMAGGVDGMITGLIVGSIAPDRHLEAMAGTLKAGKVVVTVEAPGMNCEERAEQLVLQRGGHVEQRALL